ncbi:MAG: dihydroorotate dehydrogenase electron transfer subunit [Acidobacteriota bacterium]
MPIYDQRLALEAVEQLSPSQYVLLFNSPEIAADCQPGQFVMIAASDSIDPLLRRPMAIYRVHRDAQGCPYGFSLLIEIYGRGTRLLRQRLPGEVVKVLGPLGVPFELPSDPAEGGEQLLVMGGVGAAPFPLLAEKLLQRGHVVRAFVGARTAESLLCLQDFEDLGVPVEVATDDGSRGYHGFVSGPLERYLSQQPSSPATLYACGPKLMMRAVDTIARAANLPLQVSFEAPMACGIGVCLSCVVKLRRGESWVWARCCREGPVFDSRELVWE